MPNSTRRPDDPRNWTLYRIEQLEIQVNELFYRQDAQSDLINAQSELINAQSELINAQSNHITTIGYNSELYKIILELQIYDTLLNLSAIYFVAEYLLPTFSILDIVKISNNYIPLISFFTSICYLCHRIYKLITDEKNKKIIKPDTTTT